MNLYNFHKVNSNLLSLNDNKEPLEYVNEYFTEANANNLNLIKRKSQYKLDVNTSILKKELYRYGVNPNSNHDYNNNNSKMSYKELQLLTKEIAQCDYDINNNIKVLNQKLSFLSYCNTELVNRRHQLQKKLNILRENEKYFEKVFYYLIQTYCPSIKIFSNILLDYRLDIPSIVEIDLSEFVSQIVSQIQRNWNEKSILEPPGDIPKSIIEKIEKSNLKKLMTFCKLSTKSSSKENIVIENEIRFCSQLIHFQKQYLNNTDNAPSINTKQETNNTFLSKKTERNINGDAIDEL